MAEITSKSVDNGSYRDAFIKWKLMGVVGRFCCSLGKEIDYTKIRTEHFTDDSVKIIQKIDDGNPITEMLIDVNGYVTSYVESSKSDTLDFVRDRLDLPNLRIKLYKKNLLTGECYVYDINATRLNLLLNEMSLWLPITEFNDETLMCDNILMDDCLDGDFKDYILYVIKMLVPLKICVKNFRSLLVDVLKKTLKIFVETLYESLDWESDTIKESRYVFTRVNFIFDRFTYAREVMDGMLMGGDI